MWPRLSCSRQVCSYREGRQKCHEGKLFSCLTPCDTWSVSQQRSVLGRSCPHCSSYQNFQLHTGKIVCKSSLCSLSVFRRWMCTGLLSVRVSGRAGCWLLSPVGRIPVWVGWSRALQKELEKPGCAAGWTSPPTPAGARGCGALCWCCHGWAPLARAGVIQVLTSSKLLKPI